MKYSHRLLAAILSAGMVLGLSGCTSCPGETKSLATLRISEVTHSVFYAPQYVALHKGFFEKRGIKPEFTNGQGADKVMAAVLSGSMDIGFAGPESVIYVCQEGRKDSPKAFAQLTRRDGSFLMGREQPADFSWEALRGKTILPGRKGGMPHMALEYVLHKKGLHPGEDVTLDDSIQFALMAGAFTGGSGDYVTLFEPTATVMEQEGKGHIVASIGEEAGELPYTTYFASQSYLREHPDIIRQFTEAIHEGQKWAASHTAREIAEVIQPSFPETDVEVLERVAKRYLAIGAWSDTPVIDEEAFLRLQEIMKQAGELEQTAEFDAVIDNTFAEEAVKALQ